MVTESMTIAFVSMVGQELIVKPNAQKKGAYAAFLFNSQPDVLTFLFVLHQIVGRHCDLFYCLPDAK